MSEPVLVVPIAVMVVEFGAMLASTAVASPFWSMVATDTSLEDQVTLPVRFWVAADPIKLPRAMNCVVSPTNVALAPLGMIASVGCDDAPLMVTVRTALPFTPPDDAVIVVVPDPTAVASPPELTVATCTLLEIHCTWLVRFCELPPAVKLPLARNWVVSAGVRNDLGISRPDRGCQSRSIDGCDRGIARRPGHRAADVGCGGRAGTHFFGSERLELRGLADCRQGYRSLPGKNGNGLKRAAADQQGGSRQREQREQKRRGTARDH